MRRKLTVAWQLEWKAGNLAKTRMPPGRQLTESHTIATMMHGPSGNSEWSPQGNCTRAQTRPPRVFNISSPPPFLEFSFLFFFLHTYLGRLRGDQEHRVVWRKACIAHRGASRYELSFGAVPAVIFDVKTQIAQANSFFTVFASRGGRTQ